MVWDVILAAAFGGFAGSGIQALVNRRNVNDQIEAQNERLEKRLESQQEQVESQIEAQMERQRGELYLEKKVEAITDTFRTLEDAYDTYTKYYQGKDRTNISEEDLQNDIKPKYREYKAAMHRLNLFLDADEADKLATLRDEFLLMNNFLSPTESSEHDPYEGMRDAFMEATEVLEQAVSQPLTSFETEN